MYTPPSLGYRGGRAGWRQGNPDRKLSGFWSPFWSLTADIQAAASARASLRSIMADTISAAPVSARPKSGQIGRYLPAHDLLLKRPNAG